jgi:hypothetical protein
MGLFIHVRGKLIRVAAHAAQKDEYLALVRLRTHDRVNISCNARFKPHNLVGSLVSSPAGKDVTRNLTSKVSLLLHGPSLALFGQLVQYLHTALGGLVKSMSCHSLILPLLEFTHDLDVQNNLGPLRTLVMICGSWSVSLSIFFSTAAFNCGLCFQILLLITGGGHCSGFIRLAMSSSLLCRSRTS